MKALLAICSSRGVVRPGAPNYTPDHDKDCAVPFLAEDGRSSTLEAQTLLCLARIEPDLVPLESKSLSLWVTGHNVSSIT